MEKVNRFIISLGGSLICPDSIDFDFLKELKELVLEKKNLSFVFICGGGKIARIYQDAASSISNVDNEQKDWIGIAATRLNAELVKSIMPKEIVYEKIISDPNEIISKSKRIIVCSGWKPGWSTDYDAVVLAKNYGADTVINMSNITNVYDSDPKKNPSAKPLSKISWKDFKLLVGDKWSPGLNMPFDPIATKEAEKNNIKVMIIGKDLKNLKKVLEGKDFVGTKISN